MPLYFIIIIIIILLIDIIEMGLTSDDIRCEIRSDLEGT